MFQILLKKKKRYTPKWLSLVTGMQNMINCILYNFSQKILTNKIQSLMKKQKPRTVKNSKNNEVELDSTNKETPVKRSRRRINNTGKNNKKANIYL